jgi:hypothetical protein
MKFFVVLCFLILKFESGACDGENRKNLSAESVIDSHATSANRVVRNSFSPQSGRNYFREMISRNEESNENTMEYTIDPEFSRFLSSKHRKQPDNHGNLGYKITREVHLPKQGRITGILKEMPVQSRLRNVDQFLGIPYAAAPTGSRRFMPPSSPLPWADVKRANKFEAVCPQRLPNLKDPDVNINKGRYGKVVQET